MTPSGHCQPSCRTESTVYTLSSPSVLQVDTINQETRKRSQSKGGAQGRRSQTTTSSTQPIVDTMQHPPGCGPIVLMVQNKSCQGPPEPFAPQRRQAHRATNAKDPGPHAMA